MGNFDRKAIDLKRVDASYAFAEKQLENERRRNEICFGGLLLAGGALAFRFVRRSIISVFGY